MFIFVKQESEQPQLCNKYKIKLIVKDILDKYTITTESLIFITNISDKRELVAITIKLIQSYKDMILSLDNNYDTYFIDVIIVQLTNSAL